MVDYIRYTVSASVRLLTTGVLVSCLHAALVAAEVPFTNAVIDSDYYEYADCKSVGDIDGDGLPDVIIGGGTQLNWYRYPAWTKTSIATGNSEFTTDMQVGDVDGDGDLDVIVPDGSSGNNLLWFENPRPAGNPATAAWTRHAVGATGGFCHDLAVGDLNGDGRLDIVARQQNAATSVFFQNTPTSWTKVTLTAAIDGEGTTVADIDRDGDLDVVQNGYWLQNPLPGGNPLTGSAWTKRTINGSWPVDVGVATGDMNNDGRLDVVLAHAESTGRMVWYEAPVDAVNGTWAEHMIDASVDYAHTFKTADVNGDGQLDVVFAEMLQSSRKRVGFYLNGGGGLSWQLQVLSTTGSHNIRIADFGNDGDIDIVGANWQGSPIEWWENKLDPSGLSLDFWTYHQVSDQHERTFSLCFPDANGDGQRDIASGRFVYLNPGSGMMGVWNQVTLPDSMLGGVHAFATLDVDGNNLADLIAQQDNVNTGTIDIYWVEAANASGTSWSAPILIGNVPRGSEPEGFQGSAVAQVNAGGRPEIIINSPQGLYYFTVPASNPAAGNWPRTFIAANNSEEGIGVADIDNDGDLDISFTTGNVNEVKWARNPGDGSGNWTVFTIGNFPEADWPDRCAASDLNGDGRVDIIVTEENSGNAPDALACWWEQPASGATSANWTRHTIATQYTMNSMDVGDVDQDGDVDIVLAEHRGTKRIAAWANDGQGNFTEHRVDEGKESHLGGRLVDLDGDGDLDLVSIAYDTFNELHLWRNDSPHHGGDTTRPAILSATAVNATTVQVVFSEPVTMASAQNPANYKLNNGASVSTALLGADTRTVSLTTSLPGSGNYTLTVNNVTDRASPANPIAPDSQAGFNYTLGGDTTPPVILSVTAENATTVQVLFSEPVTTTSGQNPANYAIDHGVAITWALLGADTRTVTLVTTPLVGGDYTLTISNLADRANPPNPIAPGSQAQFSFSPLTASSRVTNGLVVLYGFEEGAGTTVHDVSGAGDPLDLNILDPAKIQWVGGGTNGVRCLSGGSAIRSPGAATKVYSALVASGQLTLEAWVTPLNLNQSGPVRIATLSQGTGSSDVNLHLGQELGSATYRLRTTDNSFNSMQADSVFVNTVNPRHLVITYDGTAQRLYVDGVQNATLQSASGTLANWDAAYPLVLGNESTLDRSWLGTVHLVALYDRAVSLAEIQQNYDAGPSLDALVVDYTPPTLEQAAVPDATTVRVLFSEPVGLAAAQSPGNYSIDHGVSISSAVVGVDTRTVTLTTSPLQGNMNYTLTVNNVTDLSPSANPIVSDSQIAFALPIQSPSLIFIQDDSEGSVTLTLSGIPGAKYVLQATGDLQLPLTWENVATNAAGANGEWTYTDMLTNLERRFYRVFLLP